MADRRNRRNAMLLPHWRGPRPPCRRPHQSLVLFGSDDQRRWRRGLAALAKDGTPLACPASPFRQQDGTLLITTSIAFAARNLSTRAMPRPAVPRDQYHALARRPADRPSAPPASAT